MLKTRKRWISLLVAVAMVAAFCIPFVGTASAACTYSMTTVDTVSAATPTVSQPIGALEATFDVPSWDSTFTGTASAVYLSLPSSPTGYGFNLAAVVASEVGGYLPPGDIIGGTGNVSVAESEAGTYGPSSIVVMVSGGQATQNATTVTVEVPLNIYVPSGVTSNIDLTADTQSGSIFASGQVAIATVGNSTLTLAVESTPAISSGSEEPVGLIDVTENSAGALASGGSPGLKLTLPPGFTWESPLTPPAVEYVWGEDDQGRDDASNISTNITSPANDGRELDISDATTTGTGSGASHVAQFFKINAAVSVDETTAQTGNITVTVGGQTSANVGTVVIGSYGQYGVTCTASGTVPTITAGIEGSNIGEFEIAEGIPGSLIWGRTITLTLPTNVAWDQAPTLDTSLSTNTGNGVSAFVSWIQEGTSGNEIQCTLPTPLGEGAGPTSNQSEPGDFFLHNMQVTPAVDFSGPITCTVGGSEGVTGTVTLAKVAAGVTMAAASTPDVQIGSANQTLGNITITELAAGNLGSTVTYTGLYSNSSGSTGSEYYYAEAVTPGGTTYLDVLAPVGVTFDTTPVVTVTSGNIQLGTATTGTGLIVDGSTTAGNQGTLQIPITSSSTTASTIQIAAPVVTIDRTVPQGPITFKVEGTAVDQTSVPMNPYTYLGGTYVALFPNDTVAAQGNVANVTTGVNGTTSGTAVFAIGQTSYTLNGNSVSMDVAPYIKDSRTFLPLRYVANALGVADSNVMWDSASQKVTIIKGSLVAQFTIGSTTMLLNGAAVTMDTAPEITSGRTCLPIAWVAEALNANVVWNATAQTVTITSN